MVPGTMASILLADLFGQKMAGRAAAGNLIASTAQIIPIIPLTIINPLGLGITVPISKTLPVFLLLIIPRKSIS